MRKNCRELETRKRAGKEGFILVTVLWIFAALAVLASIYAVYVGNTAAAARVYDQRLQTEALIKAGLELTAYRLIGFDDNSRPSSGAFDFDMGPSHADVEFHSEGARIDLNLAPKALLSGLAVTLGSKPAVADDIADRIIAWRTKPANTNQNKEAQAYRDAGLNYAPRQAPFQTTAELRLIRDLPPEFVSGMLPFVTVFNGRQEIDINEAAPEVIASLPSIRPDSVAEIVKRRDPQNPQAVLSLLGGARAGVAIGGRKAVRVNLQITLETGRKVHAEVVEVIADNSREPYRVLAWHDDFDGSI